MKTKTAATVTIHKASQMSKRGRTSIAKWLRRQAGLLERIPHKLANHYTARWQYMAAITIVCAITLLAAAQSPLDNVPTTTLDAETLSVAVGSTMQGVADGFESEVSVRYDVWKSLSLAVNVQTGSGSSSLDSAGLFLQVRKVWPTIEIYGLGGLRRNWRYDKWEGVGGVGTSWTPLAAGSGILSKTSLVLEQRVVGSELRSRPVSETFTAVRYSF